MKKYVAYAASLLLIVSAGGMLAAETFEQSLSRIFHNSGIKAESTALKASVGRHSAQRAAKHANRGSKDGGRIRPGGPGGPVRNPGAWPGRTPYPNWDLWRGHRGWGSYYGRWGWDGYGRPHWWGWGVWRGGNYYACVNYYYSLRNNCDVACQQEFNACANACAYYPNSYACVAQCGSSDDYCRNTCSQDWNSHVRLYCR